MQVCTDGPDGHDATKCYPKANTSFRLFLSIFGGGGGVGWLKGVEAKGTRGRGDKKIENSTCNMAADVHFRSRQGVCLNAFFLD